MNTIEISDCVRAMRSPENRSRMIAIGMIIRPEVNSPSTKRKASSRVKSRTSAQASEIAK